MPTPRRYTSPLHATARFVAQRMLLKPLVWSLLDIEVTGRERLANLRRPALVASNHASDLDTPLILCSLPQRLGIYVATGAAADRFFQGWWRKRVTGLFFNTFPIDRSGQRGRNGITTDLLDSGVPILLYPEGTRSRTGRMGRFTAGSAALCIRLGVPCVPFAIVGAFEAMPTGQSWPNPGRPKVRVSIGQPLYPEPGETPRDFAARMAACVRSMYDEHAQQIGLPTMDQRDRELANSRGPRSGDVREETGLDIDDSGRPDPEQDENRD